MLKKVITTVLSICLLFSVCVMNVSAMNETTPETQQGNENRQWGGRGGMPQMGERPSGNFTPPEGFTPPKGDFTPPEGFNRKDGNFTPPESNKNNNTETTAPEQNEGVTKENPQPSENKGKSGQTQNQNPSFNRQMPEGMGGFPGNMQNRQNTPSEQPTGFWGFVKTYSTPVTSVILLGLAYLFVAFYKRKQY